MKTASSELKNKLLYFSSHGYLFNSQILSVFIQTFFFPQRTFQMFYFSLELFKALGQVADI